MVIKMESWKRIKVMSKYINYDQKQSMRSNKAINGDDHAAVCKKHPRHKQSPGVCSICLTDKLSQLVSNYDPINPIKPAAKSPSFSWYSSYSASYLSSLSSSNASSYSSSPVMSYMKSKRVLKKSRSLMAADDQNGMKFGGFWSKLLPPNTSRSKLMHSTTMIREREITMVY